MKDREYVTRRSALKAMAAAGISISSFGGNSFGEETNKKQNVGTSNQPPFDITPTKRAIERLLTQIEHSDQITRDKQYVNQIDFEARPTKDGADYFEIGTRGNRPVIKGTSPAVLLAGFNWYLKYVVGANITWNGTQLNLPNKLPAPSQSIRKDASVDNRFALNDTTDGYTEPYETWEYWEHEIDLLALHGINKVLVYPGQEAVYYHTLQEFGYSKTELRNWIPNPAHQPWWLLQNMCCFANPISEELIQKRIALGQKIVKRLRKLGMTPVFPGYYGTVPRDFDEKHSDAHVIPQGTWAGGFERPGWLDPTGKYFPEVAETFYRHQSELFGDSSMYKMDLLHEGGTAGDVDVRAASKAVQNSLRDAHSDATWAILGWRDNPLPETIEAVDTSKMLILDGISEMYSDLNREEEWNGTPYAFGTIWNFGGNTTMGANMAVWNDKFWRWHAKSNSALSGIAMMPEAIDNNPVAFEFFTELAWRDEPVDFDDWFETWTRFRYGGMDEDAVTAWRALAQTAYSMPDNGSRTMAQVGLYGSRPSFDTLSQRYNTAEFACALPALLNVDRALRDNSAYRYDLMDVTRQVLSNRSFDLLPRIEKAYNEQNIEQFREYTDLWLRYIELMDAVVSTHEQMLLGPWVEDARSMASSEEEAARLEYDARSLITVWGNQDVASVLHDYAKREWAGLLSDFYYSRWQKFFDEREAALAENRKPNEIDWYLLENEWARKQNDYAVEPTGDIYQISQRVLEEIRDDPLPFGSDC